MQPLLDELCARPGVQAVFLLSSTSTGGSRDVAFDTSSDFDIALVLDVPMAAQEWRPEPADSHALLQDRLPAWLPKFLFHVPTPWGAMEVNVHQLVHQYEMDPRTAWDDGKCEVYESKCDVLIDHDGAFTAVAAAKCARARALFPARRRFLANRLTWDVRIMPLRQARRLGPAAGHHLLNQAVDEAIDLVYLTHDEFVPHQKWKLPLLLRRGHLSQTRFRLLEQTLRADPTSHDDLERRVVALEEFCLLVHGLRCSGSTANETQKHFQQRIQLRPLSIADQVVGPHPGDADCDRHDAINFTLCATRAEGHRVGDGPHQAEAAVPGDARKEPSTWA
jgi:hypothetical protein